MGQLPVNASMSRVHSSAFARRATTVFTLIAPASVRKVLVRTKGRAKSRRTSESNAGITRSDRVSVAALVSLSEHWHLRHLGISAVSIGTGPDTGFPGPSTA